MTLKELLDKVDFDRLVPFIEKTEGKHLDSIYGFREAVSRVLTWISCLPSSMASDPTSGPLPGRIGNPTLIRKGQESISATATSAREA